MTVDEARKSGCCRICMVSFPHVIAPEGWQFEFGELVYPIGITMNFGDEFAHTACLIAPPTNAEERE